ncbi:GDSL-type esterase/lipase family protein [Corynebacterium dentalis]|uniref:GDSL-type esterase/lipase family protein n=1 Tax=Corynebacterium dentalis TaxID=2014528 RepID=UPI00289BDC2F|nr:GDSL-type esterase/lipase family protein [Corynebacterium dentalis]
MHSQRVGLPAKLVAALVAVFSFVALAPAAQAAPTNIVLFGDSLLANPAFNVAEAMQGPGKVSRNAPTEGRCPRGEKRVAAELQAQTGIQVEDFACTGATVQRPIYGDARLENQVNQALAQRQLTPGTRNVMFQIGINDTFKAPNLYNVQLDEYVKEVRRQVARVRAAAPNAKVTMVGYPEIVDRAGNSCWVHWNGVEQPPLAIAPLNNAIVAAHNWQRAAANAVGANWLNLEAATRGHGSCAPRDQRWISGVIDNNSKPFNITTHLTHEGNRGVAAVIARNL